MKNFFSDALNELKNDTYKAFTRKLVPNTKYEILGVKVPAIKQIAKDAIKNPQFNADKFLSETHTYYEEWFIHGLVIAYSKTDLSNKLALLEKFFPYADNWAVCDTVASTLKPNARDKILLYEKIKKWLFSPYTYGVRFAVDLLIDGFSGENFTPEILDLINSVKFGEYYIDMAVAWYYSVLLVKHYEEVLYIFTNPVLPRFVHNKAIQKAVESFRIDDDKKILLKTLKI